jgi:hypothetical protein
MVRQRIFRALVGILLVFTFTVISCPNGLIDTDTGDDRTKLGDEDKDKDKDPITPQTLHFIYQSYELIITEDVSAKTVSMARYALKSGDSYEIKIGGAIKSSGTVSIEEGGVVTFSPSSGKPSFTAIIGNGIISGIGEITLDDDTKITIPALTGEGYTGGMAYTEAVITETTVAGIQYTETDETGGTNNWVDYEYLLSMPYDDALTILKTTWGNPDEIMNTMDIGVINVELVNTAKSDGNALFKMVGLSHYGLATWVEFVLEGVPMGGWSTAIWYKQYGREIPLDTESTIGGLEYIQKDEASGSFSWDNTHYLLSVSFEEALDVLTELWGIPSSGNL